MYEKTFIRANIFCTLITQFAESAVIPLIKKQLSFYTHCSIISHRAYGAQDSLSAFFAGFFDEFDLGKLLLDLESLIRSGMNAFRRFVHMLLRRVEKFRETGKFRAERGKQRPDLAAPLLDREGLEPDLQTV